MVKSDQSGLDLQISSKSMQIISMSASCHGSFNMRLFRSIVSWSDQMGRPHLRRCSGNLRGHRLFILGNVFLLTFSAQSPAQKLQIRASPQKSFGLWLGKDVITGMHIVTLMDGQILRTRTITRLTREDQFKLEEFKKFKIAVHESSVTHKEDSYDQMLFKDLVRRFLLQQRNQVAFESANTDSRVIHSPDPLQESSAQGASSVPSAEGASSSDHHGIPHPPGLPQPQQPRRRITGKQPPSEFEINMINSLKQGILEINDFSVNSDQREDDQELQLLQDLKLQEWYQGDLQGYSQIEVKEAIKKELISLSSVGHEVYDPVPLSLLSSEDQAKIIESRWVIGPRSGQLKARFVGKGYTQIIDKESKYAHTPQATTLKIILLMSQIHKWSLCVSDVASALLNTPIDESKGFIHVQAPPEIQYPEPTVWRLKRQLYGLRDSPRSWQIHLNQVLKSLNLSQMKSDPCTFTGVDSKGHLNLMVMAYVDDLIVSGEAQAVQTFIQEIQKTFSLKHVDYLTTDSPVEFLGRIIKVKNQVKSPWNFLRSSQTIC